MKRDYRQRQPSCVDGVPWLARDPSSRSTRARLDDVIGVGLAVAGALATVALQLLYQYRAVVKPRGEGSVSFPDMSSRG
jgi:hypothetical protein